MNNLSDMLWIELRKAIRSRMPLLTALGSLFMPLGIAFLIFVAKNPEIPRKLGLISAKANLVACTARLADLSGFTRPDRSRPADSCCLVSWSSAGCLAVNLPTAR